MSMSLCSDRCHHIINWSSGVFVSEACGALNTAIAGNSMNNSCSDIYKLLNAIRFLSVRTKAHVRHSFLQTAVTTITVTKIETALSKDKNIRWTSCHCVQLGVEGSQTWSLRSTHIKYSTEHVTGVKLHWNWTGVNVTDSDNWFLNVLTFTTQWTECWRDGILTLTRTGISHLCSNAPFYVIRLMTKTTTVMKTMTKMKMMMMMIEQ